MLTGATDAQLNVLTDEAQVTVVDAAGAVTTSPLSDSVCVRVLEHPDDDVQVPDAQPLGNGRGLFTADDDGRYHFRSIVPAHYPIPTDGPVGQLLTATKRHPYRPAHVHFIVEAEGYVPVTTHVFVAGSPYLDSDAVFAVKQALVRDFAPVDDADTAARLGLPNPFRRAEFDVVLQPVA